MSAPNTIEPVFRALSDAAAALENAQRLWGEAVAAQALPASPELDRAAALIDGLTHDLSSEIRLGAADLQSLLARLRLRNRFSVFTPKELTTILASGWSPSLLQALQTSHSQHSLADLSTAVRELLAEWQALPPVRSLQKEP